MYKGPPYSPAERRQKVARHVSAKNLAQPKSKPRRRGRSYPAICRPFRLVGGGHFLLPSQFGVDEGVEFAPVEDRLDVVGFDVGAVVFDSSVVEDVGADLAAEADGFGVADDGFHFLVALGLFQSLQLALEDGEGEAFVLLLGAFDGAGDGDSGGLVGDSDGGGDFVDVLAAGAGGADEGD